MLEKGDQTAQRGGKTLTMGIIKVEKGGGVQIIGGIEGPKQEANELAITESSQVILGRSAFSASWLDNKVSGGGRWKMTGMLLVDSSCSVTSLLFLPFQGVRIWPKRTLAYESNSIKQMRSIQPSKKMLEN